MVRPRPRWIRPLLMAATALLALELAHAITDLGPVLGPFAANWLFSFLPLAAAAACAARAVAVPAGRAVWAAMAVAMVAWSAADAYYVWGILRDPSPPYPSWTDAGWLPFYPACLVAVLALLRTERRRPPAPVVLDAAVAALAAGTALAALVAPWLVGNVTGGTAAVLVTLAYPVFDILLLAAAMIAFALTGWRPGTRWCLIAAGLILRVVEDTGWLHMVTHGGYVHGGLMDVLCPASMLLIGWAAWTPPVTPARAVPAYGPHALIVPAAGVLTALGILVADHVVDLPLPALLLAGGTCLAVVARMGLTYRELRGLAASREEALTDDLTGLANRRRLVRDLDAALAARAPHTFALFDLDGFKRFNDLLGHSAGDDLLARLAERLQDATGDGTAYRLGGDEFCLLVPGDREDVVCRAVSALTHEGDVAVRPSAGVVRLPQEADDATYALQLADERMYLVKESGRAPFERQVRDVLLGVLAEQQPDLHAHAGGVAEHVRAIGRRLGLDHRELQQLVWAAELHDVGKVALPRQMLEKRGPLDEAEWRLMRTHTLIGERVLGSAPALRAAARLVRSSHERWDGRGYPDGLAGEEIPLGARIIAACDAYDAMRSERPYQRARSHAAAMTELRRCAGTQFDATVVAALEAELSPGFVADVATTASGEAAPPSPPLRPLRGRPAR